jgi:hypothetical protein
VVGVSTVGRLAILLALRLHFNQFALYSFHKFGFCALLFLPLPQPHEFCVSDVPRPNFSIRYLVCLYLYPCNIN